MPQRRAKRLTPKNKQSVKTNFVLQESQAQTSAADSKPDRMAPFPAGPPIFDPGRMDRKIITIPLAMRIEEQEAKAPGSLYKVIIDLNLTYQGGRDGARARVLKLLDGILGGTAPGNEAPQEGINSKKSEFSDQYLFGQFTAKTLFALVAQDKESNGAAPAATLQASSPERRAQTAIYLIWPDFAIGARLTKSVSTVKADAARLSFSATGAGILWAVLDSGIQGDHVHFAMHNNLAPKGPAAHKISPLSEKPVRKNRLKTHTATEPTLRALSQAKQKQPPANRF